MAYDDETIDHLLTRSMYATSVMDDEGAWVLLVEVPYLPISGFMYVYSGVVGAGGGNIGVDAWWWRLYVCASRVS